jgi:hypothetical protein
MPSLLPALATVVLLAQPFSAASAQPTSAPVPVTATPLAGATLAPAIAATPTPPAVVTCPTAPTPALPTAIATPDYQYRFVPRQPDRLAPCQPQIFVVELNSKDLVSSGDIDIHVVTNNYVTRVVTKNGGREGTIPQVAPTDFIAFSKLPKLPFIARGMTLDLQFVAYGVDGKTVTVSVPVKLH